MTDTKRPREFWIVETQVGTTICTTEPTLDKDGFLIDQINEYTHVREVLPINWEKVWEEYYSVIGDEFDEPLLQKLVERALRGEE